MVEIVKFLILLTALLSFTTVFADDAVIETVLWPEPENVPSLANGHLGLVIYGNSILMNGLYNGEKGESHRARIPNYSNVSTSAECNQDVCTYTLDMRKGFFQNVISTESTHRVTQQLCAHRFFNRAIFNHFRLERASSSARLSVQLSIEAGEVPSVDLDEKKVVVSNISGRNITIRCYETLIREDTRYQPTPSSACIGYTNPPPALIIEILENVKNYLHITAVAKNEEEVIKELTDIFDALDLGTDLVANHTSTWESHWNRFEISADDGTKTNQIIHSSMFYLISNLPSEVTNQPKDPFWGLSPGGLPKGGVLYMEYQGHSFWDTEMWMHPPILLLNPKWSEEILDYRYRMRKAAADNAKNTSYGGYRYPWESAFTGREVTPDCCPEVVEYQHHIIADIAFAFRSHLAATRDITWWENYGCDIAYNTAKFWESRAKFNASTRLYDIRNVMGPDEDHHDIDNNVYTNVIAAINLYFGDFAGCACKDVLGISDADFEKFAKIARSLTLLYDEEKDFHPQFEGYAGDKIKQADAVLLGYPLQYLMKATTKQNDLIYYDGVTRVDGPAMTWAMHTIGFLDINDEVKADEYFNRSYSLYTREPFNVWSESIPGMPAAGNFITGAGGFLQSVINGYGGVRLHFDHLQITKSFVPQGSNNLELKGISYLKNVFSLMVNDTSKTLSVVNFDPTHVIRVTADGTGRGDLTQGFSVTVPRDSEIFLRPISTKCTLKETLVGSTVINQRLDVIDDEWTLGSNYLPQYFDIPALSNGHVGFLVFNESILLNGLYNGEKGESHRARIPNFSNVTTNIECDMGNCVYHLHLKHAFFEKTTYDGNNFKVTQQIYAHRYYNRAIINRIVLEKIDGTAEISVDLKLAPGDEESVDLTLIQTKLDRVSGHDVVTRCYETKLREDPVYQLLSSKVCISHTEIPSKLTVLSTQGRAEFIHITAVGRTEEEVRKELFDIFANEINYESLFNKHAQAWESDFESYEISVANSKKLNQVLHSSMFYLLSNLPSSSTNQPKDPFWGLSPSGIARGGIVLADYQGHSFWDTEMWMHPPILLLNPKWSEEILDYRYRTRKSAADNANYTGFKGYRYPWESAFTGAEVTPVCCPQVVEYQHHIIADIAFGFRSHLAATHDLDWWKSYGCDIAYNTAKFWESRVDFDNFTQLYNIRNVMGPDEDHNATDNNVYTNVIAAINLYFGEFAGCTCKDVLRLTDEDFENFSKIARSLKLVYDEEKDFHPQHENYTEQEIKQADVVLVGYPLQFPMDQSTKRNNLIFYDNKTRDSGPAMTWSMHTIGYLDIQDQNEAAKNFEKSWSVYTHMPFLTWSENQPGIPAAGNFITGMGGFLQSVINGYGGVRLHFDHLSISNFYMPQAGPLKINGLTYLNNRFSLEISGREATLKFLNIDIENPIIITINPGSRKLLPSTGVTLTINRDQELIIEPVTKSFGSCELKKTEIGHRASAGSLKMSLLLIISSIFLKSLI